MVLLSLVIIASLAGSMTTTPLVVKFDKSADKENKADVPVCGYKGCDLGKPDMINVHLVPHTHDDVGWLKTVDQYFYGARNDIQHAGVQYIIDTVTNELNQDSQKRFIYVEIAYFYRWWNEQHDSVQHAVKRLVNEGRLEFILGGWCMNDEASTHYNAIIDQHTLGFRFLDGVFGECGRPRIGWQIDPFGHSREQASLFAQFGFDGLFFARLDYQDWDTRAKSKTMEMMWMGSDNLGDESSLFTGVLYNGYGEPGGFCFDIFCGDDPIRDDTRLEDYNVDDRVDAFLKATVDQASHYTTNHIMMTMGSDFQYENAHENFKNLDKLIMYVNARQVKGSKVNVLYSTPSCYVYALNQANQTYTSKKDDFFPYASNDHTFWTGYFTSRPALKGYVRTCNNFLQVCKQLEVLAQIEFQHSSDMKVNVFREAMGVVQHHDGVSGTEKQHVADDYAKRLAIGVESCQEVVDLAYSYLLPITTGTVAPTQQFCNLLNISYCPVTEGSKQFTVLIYNPIGRPVMTFVRVPVSAAQKSFTVQDSHQSAVKSQLIPISPQTKAIPERSGSMAAAELVFPVSLPPLGFSTYFVNSMSDESESEGQILIEEQESQRNAGDFMMKNQFLSLTFDGTTGFLKSLTNLEKSKSVNLVQRLMYYESFVGNNSQGQFQSSGAYVFRPIGETPKVFANIVQVTTVQGPNVQEVRQVYGDGVSQVTRLYDGERHFEVEWTVGPINIADNIGKEVINLFKTDLQSASTFFTDANGRQVLRRIRDYRQTWKLNQSEPVSGNYYPVNSRIFIQDIDKNLQLTVLTDRSQGGTSAMDGQLELMVHRRILHDDSFGVGEPLSEPGFNGKGLVVRGTHYVYFDTIDASSFHHRDKSERLFMAPSISFSTGMSAADYAKKYKTMWSGLSAILPPNVHLLTLEQWRGRDFLLRLEHFYESTDDPVLSKPATVSLKGLFVPFKVTGVTELTLGANQLMSNAQRLSWNVAGFGRTTSDMKRDLVPVDPNTLSVTLKSMQIRTFRVSIE